MSKIDLSTIDVQESVEAIEKIFLYSYKKAIYSHCTAQELVRAPNSSEKRTKDSIVFLRNRNIQSRCVYIENEFHAKKLIKALQLALKLEWFKKE